MFTYSFLYSKEYLPATQRRLFTLLRQEREDHRVPEEEARRSLWLARMLDHAGATGAPLLRSALAQPAVLLYTGE